MGEGLNRQSRTIVTDRGAEADLVAGEGVLVVRHLAPDRPDGSSCCL